MRPDILHFDITPYLYYSTFSRHLFFNRPIFKKGHSQIILPSFLLSIDHSFPLIKTCPITLTHSMPCTMPLIHTGISILLFKEFF